MVSKSTVVLLLALFHSNLQAHFKNLVTHLNAACANPSHTFAQICTHHNFINGPITVRYSGHVASEPIAKWTEILELQPAYLW